MRGGAMEGSEEVAWGGEGRGGEGRFTLVFS